MTLWLQRQIYRFLGLFAEVRELRQLRTEHERCREDYAKVERQFARALEVMAETQLSSDRAVELLRGQLKILGHLVQPPAPAPVIEQPPVEAPVSEPPDSSPPVWEQLEKRNGDWVRVGFVREHSHAWHHVMRSPKMALRSPAGEIHEGVQ